MTPQRNNELRHSVFWGLALIALGALFLVDRLGLADVGDVWNYWPAFIALHGAVTALFAQTVLQAVDGIFTIVVAFWIWACIEHVWGWTFIATWPVVVIAGGVVILLRGALGPKEGNGEHAR
jgi:hypothetical protein